MAESEPRRAHRGRPRSVERLPGSKVRVELRLDPEATDVLFDKATTERRTVASVVDRLLLGEDQMEAHVR